MDKQMMTLCGTQKAKLQSLDEIRLIMAENAWDTDRTVDEVFYDSSVDETTLCGKR